MTRPADEDVTSKSSRQRQKPTAKVGFHTRNAGGYMASAFAVVITIVGLCLDVGHGFSSTALSCTFDLINCTGDDVCNACLAVLQGDDSLLGDDESEVCSELYGSVCVTLDSLNCDTENEPLINLLTCVAEEAYDCTDFTTCANVTAGSGGGSDGFEGAVTEAPSPLATAAAAAATPAPSRSAAATVTNTPSAATPAPAPTFSTPTLPFPTTAPVAAPTATPTTITTASPSAGSSSSSLAPTAAPTIAGDGSRAINTAYPSAAPSAASAAPTGFDAFRGGGEGVFSAAPTASPTAFEDPGGREEDTVSGGVVARFTAGSSACSVISAAAMVGYFVAAVAAWDVRGKGKAVG